jgi:hypothetical protein
LEAQGYCVTAQKYYLTYLERLQVHISVPPLVVSSASTSTTTNSICSSINTSADAAIGIDLSELSKDSFLEHMDDIFYSLRQFAYLYITTSTSGASPISNVVHRVEAATLVVEVIESMFGFVHVVQQDLSYGSASTIVFPTDLLLLLAYAKMLQGMYSGNTSGITVGNIFGPMIDCSTSASNSDTEDVDIVPALLILDPILNQLTRPSSTSTSNEGTLVMIILVADMIYIPNYI